MPEVEDPVVLLDVMLLDVEVSFSPVITCDIVVLSVDIAPSDVMFEVDDMLLPASDVVSVLVDSGVSYIMAAMRPLAENVDPSAAVEVWLSAPVAFPVPAEEVELSEAMPPVPVLFEA